MQCVWAKCHQNKKNIVEQTRVSQIEIEIIPCNCFLLNVFLLVVLRSAFGMRCPKSKCLLSKMVRHQSQFRPPKIFKKTGSKAWERFEKYKHATNIEAMRNSGNGKILVVILRRGA